MSDTAPTAGPWPPPGTLVLRGRVLQASNATFVGEIGEARVVYKPVAGERPLWDFPDGTLAGREVAAYVVSEALGWDIVPPTCLYDGPHGRGMVQRWVDIDPEQAPVTIVPHGQRPNGYVHILDGVDERDRRVSLMHEGTQALRRMAVFDVIVNNADRKGGHILALHDGHRHGIDHGVTFHDEPKLRTVLWGWVGEALCEPERAALEDLLTTLNGPSRERLTGLISEAELQAMLHRIEELLQGGRLPAPSQDWPAIPWPPF